MEYASLHVPDYDTAVAYATMVNSWVAELLEDNTYIYYGISTASAIYKSHKGYTVIIQYASVRDPVYLKYQITNEGIIPINIWCIFTKKHIIDHIRNRIIPSANM